MSLSSYIFLGTLLNRVWIYLFVGAILGFFSYFLVSAVTNNLVMARIIGMLVFLLFVGFFSFRNYQKIQKVEEHYAKEDMRNQVPDNLVIDEGKCMSCTTKLNEGDPVCPNCGYKNKVKII